jgi:hypothetical protein
MDEGCSKAVNEVFVRLYEKGLIYRGERMINWCPHCKTSISDAEVNFAEQAGALWYIRYPLTDGSGDIVVATTRPETMLGDTGCLRQPGRRGARAPFGKNGRFAACRARAAHFCRRLCRGWALGPAWSRSPGARPERLRHGPAPRP